jgi:hypothetical protein
MEEQTESSKVWHWNKKEKKKIAGETDSFHAIY